jgi:hypothetical protein
MLLRLSQHIALSARGKRLRGVGETSLAAMSSWKASNDFCWTQIGTKHRCNLSRQRPGSLRRKRISGGVTNK